MCSVYIAANIHSRSLCVVAPNVIRCNSEIISRNGAIYDKLNRMLSQHALALGNYSLGSLRSLDVVAIRNQNYRKCVRSRCVATCMCVSVYIFFLLCALSFQNLIICKRERDKENESIEVAGLCVCCTRWLGTLTMYNFTRHQCVQ